MSTVNKAMLNPFYRRTYMDGLSLVEIVVSVAVFAFVAVMLYSTYQRAFDVVRVAQSRVDAIALANAQFEIVRNLPYAQIGTVGGVPSGVLIPVRTLQSSGRIFIATTTVRNIDQLFDGVIGGTPNDLSPADNKLVEIELMCTSCKNFRPLIFNTSVGPKDLESASTNGSLFVSVLDANGLPVVGASVHVVNTTTAPPIDILDVTPASGILQIIDAPPALESYEVTVSKSGYSSERTYKPGIAPTINPVKPHATVAVQTLTQLTFMIDRTATLDFSSVDSSCTPIPNVDFELTGSKLIATAPNVIKYDKYYKTNESGVKQLTDIEWDTYTLVASTTEYKLIGVVPLSPLPIAPGAMQNVQLVMKAEGSSMVLVTVKDSSTGLPITGATVTLHRPNGDTSIETTGRGFLSQTDWSGGAGQSDYVDHARYANDDSSVDTSIVNGSVKLRNILGLYSSNGTLESSTFDTGAPANFYQFTYQPTGQPVETGESSVQFQIATGNSTSSWTYLGPDGTANTYYNSTTTDISAINNGKRYLRYKMFLSTASSTFTPSVSDIQFTFTSVCAPPGQVMFEDIHFGNYDLTVSAPGYATYVQDFVVDAAHPWQDLQVILNP